MLNRVHIAMYAEKPLGRGRVEQLAQMLGVSQYDVRMRLKTPFARSIAFRATEPEAHELACRIHDLDVVTLIFEESGLPPVAPFLGFRMGKKAGGFIFEDRKGERRTLPTADMRFVVFGRAIKVSTSSTYETRETTYTMRGARSSVKVDVVKNRTTELNAFAVFFENDPSKAPIRISADHFDYQCLGKLKGHSDETNMRKVLEIIEAGMKEVPNDKRLVDARIGGDMIAHNKRVSPDPSYAAAVIIYWEYLAKQSGNGFLNAARLQNVGETD